MKSRFYFLACASIALASMLLHARTEAATQSGTEFLIGFEPARAISLHVQAGDPHPLGLQARIAPGSTWSSVRPYMPT
jgi:hypothetical protein